jgi:hypothetical protein
MLVTVKRYAEDSFAVLCEWQAELHDVLHDEGCVWTTHQQEELERGLPVWISGTLLVRKPVE